MSKEFFTHTNLTFVPNSFCNFGCKYCYLGKLTENKDKNGDVISSLKKILEKITDDGVLVSSLNLHGAEVTTLPREILEGIFQTYQDYTQKYKVQLKSLNKHGENGIGIKTNLYNFDKLRDLFLKYNVFVSGSFDLPFTHHEKFRVLKNGKSTLDRVRENVLLLSKYPKNLQQISCTIGKFALLHFDEFCDDLEWLDEQGFDMVGKFYIMFIYDSANSHFKTGLSDDEMVLFYEKLLKRFKGTKFEDGIYYNWFKEFTHGYCSHQINCGATNHLYQKSGDVYPCHRSQPDGRLKYGNIFEKGFLEITKSGIEKMKNYEASNKAIHSDCMECDYFHICNMGCPVERMDRKSSKSYTCKLQLALYKAQPKRFKADKVASIRARDAYINQMQPNVYLDEKVARPMRFNPEMIEVKNSLNAIIQRDEKLKTLYKNGAIKLRINDNELIPLFSTTKLRKQLNINLFKSDKLEILVEYEYMGLNDSDENSLFIMFLNNTSVVYGDEQRVKMSHIGEYIVHKSKGVKEDGHYVFNINEFFLKTSNKFLNEEFANLVCFTTTNARAVHYKKQSLNAFYHLEAINLPFHEFRFNYKE
ncbi:putative sulfatase maturation enzyme, radical SAM superfamily [Campylobacter blaseri]|nr:SPASM domain-containing protein [Campylobacter blaseri]QKF86118.1 putative sulfatase maturation enzyme, radical SAM superfamily [Campylobacter blaseri]